MLEMSNKCWFTLSDIVEIMNREKILYSEMDIVSYEGNV